MSDQEQDAAILRLVKQRGEYKRRIVLLESELRAAGRALFEIAGGLREVSAGGASHTSAAWVLGQVAKAPEICALPRIAEMLAEVAAKQETLAELNRSAADLGID